jgi:hypothetical protein
MRIIIESDELTPVLRQAAAASDRSAQAIDAGPPPRELIDRAAHAARPSPTTTGSRQSGGADGGGAPV